MLWLRGITERVWAGYERSAALLSGIAPLAESWGQGTDIPIYHQFTFCFPI